MINGLYPFSRNVISIAIMTFEVTIESNPGAIIPTNLVFFALRLCAKALGS